MSKLLLQPFTTPFESAPFAQINVSDFLPAIKQLITSTTATVEALSKNPENPTFKNTIEALEFSGLQLERVLSIFFNLSAAETNTEIQNIALEISPLLSEFKNSITLNKALFKRIKLIYHAKQSLNLNTEQNTLLEHTYKGFAKNGANLSEAKKNTLRELDKQLSLLCLNFGNNVLAETNAYQLHITNPKKLVGIPENAIETAAHLAESKNLSGWVFNLQAPSYMPIITYANDRTLRKQIMLANGAKGFQKNAFNNEEIVLNITQLRAKRAQLLGYKTHAHFVLEERMAKTPETVKTFLNTLLEKAKPVAEKELNELKQFAKDTYGIKNLQKWDIPYYSEKLKQKLYQLDDEALKPYFKLENVISGVFAVAQKLYGLQFEEDKTIDTYHDAVLTYKVTDNKGAFVALLYADFFPRSGKRNGAWMTVYKPQYIIDNNNSRPHISIVCNFTKPTKTKPSLLSFNEVTTLFHEFGHALHGMLANTTYPSLSGTNVYWDFVELPSQLLENWCYEKEALQLFAKHYKTGETIPMAFIDKIKASANFHQGLTTLRQLSFGILDMQWHAKKNIKSVTSVKRFENSAIKNTQLIPDKSNSCFSTAFSHIFQGGYSSGYYSYKWAEVLDADAFAYFKEEGVFNPIVANKFKTFVLSQGGSDDPLTLYKKFRGKDPNPDALLRRSGLL